MTGTTRPDQNAKNKYTGNMKQTAAIAAAARFRWNLFHILRHRYEHNRMYPLD
jgi:hypothetical protein